jgi:heat shock protein HslJ
MRFRTLLAVVLVLSATACDWMTSPSDIVGETWQLVSLQESGSSVPIVVADPSKYKVTFNSGGTLAITSDCNTCTASYTKSGTTLTISSMACTLALCTANSLDAKFTKALQAAQTIAQKGHDLTIQGGGNILLFRD